MHRLCLRASHILSLIAALQAPSISAHPSDLRPLEEENLAAVPRNEPRAPQGRPPGPLPPVPWEIYTNPGEVWQPAQTAYEIADGQVQVAYAVYTHTIPSAVGVQPVINTASFTRWHHHPAGPGWGPPPWTLPPGLSTSIVSAPSTISSVESAPTTGSFVTTISTPAASDLPISASVPSSSTSVASPVATSLPVSTILVNATSSATEVGPVIPVSANQSLSAVPTTISTLIVGSTATVSSLVTATETPQAGPLAVGTSTLTVLSTVVVSGSSTSTITSISTISASSSTTPIQSTEASPVDTSGATTIFTTLPISGPLTIFSTVTISGESTSTLTISSTESVVSSSATTQASVASPVETSESSSEAAPVASTSSTNSATSTSNAISESSSSSAASSPLQTSTRSSSSTESRSDAIPQTSSSLVASSPLQTSTSSSSSTESTSDAIPQTSSSASVPSSSQTLEPIAVTTGTTVTLNPSSSAAISTETSTTSHRVTVTTIPNASLTSLSTSAVQSATSSKTSKTTGSVVTSLETSGNPSVLPFPTSITKASSLSLVDTSTLASVVPTASTPVTSIQANNIFQPIGTAAPPPQISSRGDHPVPRLGIQQQQDRLETNKFYANFFLGSQSSGTWTHPYSLAWSKGSGQSDSWGLAISHIERSQLVGPGTKEDWDAGDWDYFQNPLGDQSLVISAAELDSGMSLTTDSLEGFSANVNLVPSGAQDPVLTFPLVQGMAYVTGQYNSGTPIVQSGLGITNVTYVGAVIDGTTYKYRVMLQNGFTWLIYVSPKSPSYNVNSFTLLSSGEIQGPSDFGGYIQIAKVPADTPDSETIFDASAGVYATAGNITGAVQGSSGSYTLSWTKQGVTSQPLLMFALPHHVESFSSATQNGLTDVQLVTSTKGMGTAVTGDSWTLDEPDLPVSMSFSPWSPELGDVSTVSASAMEAINDAAYSELSQNISMQTNVGSLYYDGKALAKFAAIIYAAHDMANNRTLALSGLALLESAFAFHVDNLMPNPLVYDTAWGGVVSISTYLSGNAGDDFGNTDYNDHHFHYGYFVYAAAVIGYLNPDWLDQGTNKAWVNMLVRDYANSITDDPSFPFSRMFDWYHGHSWAHGLIETADGKDQESSSEDTMSSYALKMWGRIVGDVNMEARGNLMLAIQARSLQHYYLYLNNNTVEPSEFIGNKVAGILFENKIQHVTYFGTNIEYIEGIHMLPIMPCSTLTRTRDFVEQEWSTYFADGALDPASQVQGGWRGILLANHAIVDPVDSYNFFTNTSGQFAMSMLDGGASQTWYLAWSAALGGSSA